MKCTTKGHCFLSEIAVGFCISFAISKHFPIVNPEANLSFMNLSGVDDLTGLCRWPGVKLCAALKIKMSRPFRSEVR